ncbi:hypothetical protein MMPV_004965 [Pyropia vietnamensis]
MGALRGRRMKAACAVVSGIAAAVLTVGSIPRPAAAAGLCGQLLPPILASCTAEPGVIRPASCCAALAPWNAAACWCDPVAFDALAAVAKNGAAFGWRAADCEAVKGEPALPPRIGGPFRFTARDTCGDAATPAEVAESVRGCDARQVRSGGAALRAARLATVGTLLAPVVTTRRGVRAWMTGLDRVLVANATFTPVGLGYYTGREDVKRALVAAQPVAGGVSYAPSADAVDAKRAFWATPDAVSVPVAAAAGVPGRVSAAFVTYEPCSARVQSLVLLTPAVTRLYDQFVFFDPPADVVSQLDQSPASWCAAIGRACTGADYPYDSPAACRSAYAAMISSGRVVCARTGGPFVPQNASVGDTTACRARFLALATAGVDVASSCSALGAVSSAPRCASGKCPGRLTVNTFTVANPRYSGSGGFRCSIEERTCKEEWM